MSETKRITELVSVLRKPHTRSCDDPDDCDTEKQWEELAALLKESHVQDN